MLEVVQVEHEDGQRLAALLAALQTPLLAVQDRLLQRRAERHPVGQAGEPVMEGQRADLLLLGPNVDPHLVEGARQLADLVVAGPAA